ncbi:MAG: glycosyltransferase family 4 protein [Anaerolineales bacterium]
MVGLIDPPSAADGGSGTNSRSQGKGQSVLLLTQILPYPGDAGPRIKTWNVLLGLHEAGYEITLLSYMREEEEVYLSTVRRLCHDVVAIPFSRSKPLEVLYLLRSFLIGRPYLVVRDDRKQMRQEFDRCVRQGDYSIVHADQVSMTQFALDKSGVHRVFDAHNATWRILQSMLQSTALWMRPFLWLEMLRMRKYEARVVSQFDRTFVVTEDDRLKLLEAIRMSGEDEGAAKARIQVVPITIDTQAIEICQRDPDPNELLTIGSLHYAPNAEGVLWLAERVFPLIRESLPQARLTIIGKNPPPRLRRLSQASNGAIRALGFVEDLNPHFRSASVFVVPVLSGSGMRVRILEAMARGVPVVTTTLGLEGIGATDGIEVIVADNEKAMARAVARLATDPPAQARLAANGRKLAEAAYDYRRGLMPMLKVYGAA